MAASYGNRDPELPNHDDTHRHGTRRDYVTGFLLSVALTSVPFWLVMTGRLGAGATAVLISVFAVMQIIVHVRFFLHVDTRSEGGWTLMSFLFTAVIVVITIGGSVWAMYQMNTNMMPTSVENMTDMP